VYVCTIINNLKKEIMKNTILTLAAALVLLTSCSKEDELQPVSAPCDVNIGNINHARAIDWRHFSMQNDIEFYDITIEIIIYTDCGEYLTKEVVVSISFQRLLHWRFYYENSNTGYEVAAEFGYNAGDQIILNN
tara:strand:- start:19 stop:420 length:402 start_codon:yes stop_codon:yes gene_type:complete